MSLPKEAYALAGVAAYLKANSNMNEKEIEQHISNIISDNKQAHRSLKEASSK